MADYHPFQIALTPGQKQTLKKAIALRAAVTLRVKPAQIEHGDTLLLTTTQINHAKKSAHERRGADIKMSQTQIMKMTQSCGNILSSLFRLARPFLVPAAKTLGKTAATAGLSFAADKLRKKISGKGYGPREIELFKLS